MLMSPPSSWKSLHEQVNLFDFVCPVALVKSLGLNTVYMVCHDGPDSMSLDIGGSPNLPLASPNGPGQPKVFELPEYVRNFAIIPVLVAKNAARVCIMVKIIQAYRSEVNWGQLAENIERSTVMLKMWVIFSRKYEYGHQVQGVLFQSYSRMQERGNVLKSTATIRAGQVTNLSPHDTKSVTAYVEAVVHKFLQRCVTPDDDLFDAGLDSLRAMHIRSSLMAAPKKSERSVSVPRNIRGLARYFQDTLYSSIDGQNSCALDTMVIIADKIEKYITDFPEHQPAVDAKKPEGGVYMVTGSTGSLGLFFVSLLLNTLEMTKIYLLGRKTNNMPGR
ncbi:hypothetical protein DFH09DRAFT_1079790 [Mycena vulgaris]|nr:hypothetical protein DFH09DRAFT_1079790 [Mycena vulgaris]